MIFCRHLAQVSFCRVKSSPAGSGLSADYIGMYSSIHLDGGLLLCFALFFLSPLSSSTLLGVGEDVFFPINFSNFKFRDYTTKKVAALHFTFQRLQIKVLVCIPCRTCVILSKLYFLPKLPLPFYFTFIIQTPLIFICYCVFQRI